MRCQWHGIWTGSCSFFSKVSFLVCLEDSRLEKHTQETTAPMVDVLYVCIDVLICDDDGVYVRN